MALRVGRPVAGLRQGCMKRRTARVGVGKEKEFEVPASAKDAPEIDIKGVEHVAVIVESNERALEFYQGVLGLEERPGRPDDRLPYRGAWLKMGVNTLHLMELPNPDPLDPSERPEHGGRDRHFCIEVDSLKPLLQRLEAAGVPYTRSKSGRPAAFFRDPDMNTIEVAALNDD